MTTTRTNTPVLQHERSARIMRWWTNDRAIDVSLSVLPLPSGGYTYRVVADESPVHFKSLVRARRHVRCYLNETHGIQL